MFFFCNDTATTEIYTLSLHDALPILREHLAALGFRSIAEAVGHAEMLDTRAAVDHWKAHGLDLAPILEVPKNPYPGQTDRKSTRLNSSHVEISYAVFCLKKKTKKNTL